MPASDYLYRSVERLAREKPVVASIRGTGASGAYLICCAAQRIVATPGSTVGSIGVISIRPVLQTLLQRLGVSVDVSKSGAYKDMGAFWREATSEEERKMQLLIDDFYGVFVSIVAGARGIAEDRVKEIATGDLDRAIDLAAELTGSPRRPVFIRPHRGMRERIFGTVADSLVESVAAEVESRLWLESLRS